MTGRSAIGRDNVLACVSSNYSHMPGRRSFTAVSVGLALAVWGGSAFSAGTFEGPGGIEGRWGMEVTVGTAVRMEDPDSSIVGFGNGGRASSSTVDDGNLNFGKGDVFSTVAKAVGEVELKKDDYGVFIRAKAYSDLQLKNKRVPHGSSNNGYTPDEKLRDDGMPDGSKFQDIQLLDAYAFADFYPMDKPLTLKVGNQVVTWGEALFVLGGINQYSNFDAAALRRPGAQLKEVFLPLPQIYANVQATDELSLEGFVQLTHEKVSVDGCGTLFSPADLLNCGQSGSPVNPGSVEVAGQFLDFRDFSDQESFNGTSRSVRVVDGSGQPLAGGAADALGNFVLGTLVTGSPGGTYNFAMPELQERRAKDSGQLGLAARYYAGSIGTEFGFYAVNYHQRAPNLSLIRIRREDAPEGSLFAGVNLPTGDALVQPTGYFFDFGQEDIQTTGMSAATEIGGFSVFGEISFTKDYPAAYNTVDLIKGGATSSGPLARYGAETTPGTILSGSKPIDKIQVQMSTIKQFPRILAAASWAVVGEIGVQVWDGIEDPFTGERFGRSPAFGAGAHQSYDDGNGNFCNFGVNPNTTDAGGDPRYCSTDGYATKTAAGYRVLLAGDYPGVFDGVTLKPRIFFAHDFQGTSADGVFLEDRMNLGLGLRAEIQSGKYFAETNYSIFDDKAFYDPFKDRDFVSLVVGANL